MAFERMAYLEAVVGADITQFRKGMRDIRNEVGVLSESMGGLAGLGRTLTYTVTAPVVAFGTMAVQQASEFDAAMRNINSIVGMSEDDLASLTAQVMDFGKETRGGATSSAEALYAVFSAGILDTADAFAIMQIASKTAEAGLADLEGTTQGLVSVLLSYGNTSAEFAQRQSDGITRMVQVGVGSMDEFTHALAGVTPTAAALGMSTEELYGDLAFLTQRGQSAATASTNLNNALTSLVKPTEAMQAAMHELGADGAEELIQKFGGVNGAFQALIGTTNGTQAELQALFNNIRGARAINAFANDIDGWNSMMAEFNASLDGATMRAWEEQGKSFAAHWDLLTSALGAAAITVGSALIPALIPLIDGITDLVLGFTELDPSIIQFGVGALAAVAAAAPLLWLLGSLGAVLNPIGAAFALAAIAIGTHWEEVVSAVVTGAAAIQESLAPVTDFMTDFWEGMFPPAIEMPVPEVALTGEPTVIDPLSIITVDTTKSLWQVFTENGYDDYFSWQEFMRLAEEGGWNGGAVEVGTEITIDMTGVRTLPPPMPLVTITGDAIETNADDVTSTLQADMTEAMGGLDWDAMWETFNFDYTASGLGDLFDGALSFVDSMASADWSGVAKLGAALLIIANGLTGATLSVLGDLLSGIGDAIEGVANAITLALDGDIVGALGAIGTGFAGLFLALGGAGATIITTITDALNRLFGLDIPSFSEWFDGVQAQFATDVENYHPDPVSKTFSLSPTIEWTTDVDTNAEQILAGQVSTLLGDTTLELDNGAYNLTVTVPANIDWQPAAVETVLDVAEMSQNMDLSDAERAAANALIDGWASAMSPEDRAAFQAVLNAFYAGGGIVITPEGLHIQVNADGSTITLDNGVTGGGQIGGTTLSVGEVQANATLAMVTANGWAVIPPSEGDTVTTTSDTPIQIEAPVEVVSTEEIATTFSEGFASGMDAQTIIDTYLTPVETKWNEMFAPESTMTTNLSAFVEHMTSQAVLMDAQSLLIVGTFTGLAASSETAFSQFMYVVDRAFSHFQTTLNAGIQSVGKLRKEIETLLQTQGGIDIQVNVQTTGGVDGSHATGLDNVPYDGYVAELHAGEQVLTADDAKDYRYDQMSAGAIMGASSGQNVTNNNQKINVQTAFTFDDFIAEAERRGMELVRK